MKKHLCIEKMVFAYLNALSLNAVLKTIHEMLAPYCLKKCIEFAICSAVFKQNVTLGR